MRLILSVFLLLSGNVLAHNNQDSLNAEKDKSTQTIDYDSLLSIPPVHDLNWSFYKTRYKETDLMQKITDNWGNGFDSLYGTRNLRPILHGAAYRGGGNNYYHKEDKRNNHNPLPDDGIKNLCEEGFSNGVYLYRNNFETAPPLDTCSCVDGAYNVMDYSQLDYYDTKHIRVMLEMVHESIVNDEVGPVYLHCWNGWHASGLISAIILRQFCGYTSWDAVNYWDIGTDGANKSPRYQKTREMIKDFVPYEDLLVTDSVGNLICPSMPEMIDSSQLHIEIEHLIIVPEAIPQGYDIVLYNVSFGPNQTSFANAQANPDVVDLIKAMKKSPELKIEIGGYTDNTGDYSKNKGLSNQRAKFVYDQVIKGGIDASRVTYAGYGESKPLYNNKYKSGREGNRRIEVKILEKHSDSEGGMLVDESNIDKEIKEENTTTEITEVKKVVEVKIENSDRDKGITLSGVNKFSDDYDTKIQLNKNYLMEMVKFEPYAITLSEGNHKQLDHMILLLNNNSSWKVNIIGYTDDSGDADANLKLSKQRANAVKTYMIDKGISAGRLTSTGKGEASPIAPNKYSWGRAQNRRIEMTIVK